MTEEPELDLRLKWQEQNVRRQTDEDTVALDSESQLERHQLEDAATGDLISTDVVGDDELDSSYLEDEDDEFQWTEERERALEEALEESPEGSIPRVQLQLEEIMKGLQSETLESERTELLLGEVDAYLAQKIAAEQGKPEVDHAEFTQSRKDKLNALFAYQEAATALREFVKTGHEMQLKVASYATEQGGSFMQSARELLMDSEPDYEEFEEDEFEDEDEDEDDYDDEEDFGDDEEWEEE